VRLDDAAVAEMVVEELGDALVPDPDPPPGYAVVIRPVADRPPARPLPQLRHGPATVMRSRDPGRLALALANHVRSHDDSDRGTVRLASAAVITDVGAVLLPAEQLWAPGLERQLCAAGYRCADTPIVELDPATCRVTGRAWDWSKGPVAFDAQIIEWMVSEALAPGRDASAAMRVAAAAQLIRATHANTAQQALEGVRSIVTSGTRVDCCDDVEVRLFLGRHQIRYPL
jgi:hypothetical protein